MIQTKFESCLCIVSEQQMNQVCIRDRRQLVCSSEIRTLKEIVSEHVAIICSNIANVNFYYV